MHLDPFVLAVHLPWQLFYKNCIQHAIIGGEIFLNGRIQNNILKGMSFEVRQPTFY